MDEESTTPSLLARIYEQLLLLNARMDDLSARLETHIAASVAERAELRNTLTAEVRGAVLAIRAETRQISAIVRRTDQPIREEHSAHRLHVRDRREAGSIVESGKASHFCYSKRSL